MSFVTVSLFLSVCLSLSLSLSVSFPLSLFPLSLHVCAAYVSVRKTESRDLTEKATAESENREWGWEERERE